MEVSMTKTVSMRHFVFSDSDRAIQTAYQTGSGQIRLCYPVWPAVIRQSPVLSQFYWFRPGLLG